MNRREFDLQKKLDATQKVERNGVCKKKRIEHDFEKRNLFCCVLKGVLRSEVPISPSEIFKVE